MYSSTTAGKLRSYCRLWDCRSLQWSNRSVKCATNHQLLRAMLEGQQCDRIRWWFRERGNCLGVQAWEGGNCRPVTHLQSLRTWWMSNSKAASKMLSRGSGTLLDSRNMVMQDCERAPVTSAVAGGRKSPVWSNSSVDLLCVPEHSNAAQ